MQSNRRRNASRKTTYHLWGLEGLEDRRVLASAWHNVLEPFNVDDSDRRTVSPIDALLVIHELTERNVIDEMGRLPDSAAGFSVPPYLDVTDDGSVSPIDALFVITALSDGSITDAAITAELASLLIESPDLAIEDQPASALGYPGVSVESAVASIATDVSPAVATTSDGGSIVVWIASAGEGSEQVLSQRYSAMGAKVGEPSVVTVVVGVVRSVDVGLTSNDNPIVTWAQRTSSDWDVYVKAVDATGQPTDPVLVHESTVGTQQTPSVAVLSDSQFAVVWQDDQQGRRIMGRFYSGESSTEVELSPVPMASDGEFVSDSFIHPDVAATIDGYFATWTRKNVTEANVEGVLIDATGQAPLAIVIGGGDIDDGNNPAQAGASSVATNEAGTYAVVVWQQRMSDQTGWDVWMRGYDLVDGSVVNGGIAGDGDSEPMSIANSASLGTGQRPSAAFDHDDPIVAWNGRGVRDVSGQFMRRYDISEGAWSTAEAVLNSHVRSAPVFATTNGGAVLTSLNNDATGIVVRAMGDDVGQPQTADDLVAFAKALAATETKFFGAAWCPHCTAQKELFEDGSQFLPFVEVTNPDRTPNDIGMAEKVTSYPTWEFPDGSRLEGEQSLATISQRSGVAIPQAAEPFLAPIADQTLLVGSPLLVSLDGYDPNGSELSYSITSSNPDVTPILMMGNRSIRFDVNGFGSMVFELFEDLAPLATERMIELATETTRTVTEDAVEREIPFYQDIIFHRVINNFMIQAGDPNGTGSGGSDLGDFDDQFLVDLQHNRTGLLSMAKSNDDTNDSQFFVTEGSSRHLDFNHTIFGVLVEGESNRDAISDTDTVSSRPVRSVSIGSTEVFRDTENAVIMLKAAAGATGSSTISVVVTDAEGLTYETSFEVSIEADTFNGGPFLTELATTFVTNADTAIVIELSSMDIEGDDVFYDYNPNGTNDQLEIVIDNDTGVMTVTPINGFTGTARIVVGVRPADGTPSDTRDTFDAQTITIEVLDAP